MFLGRSGRIGSSRSSGTAPSRPIAHLAGFSGVLQVDGYGGHKVLARRNAVQLAFCWSHVRRRLYELAQAGPAPIATEALAHVAAIYQIENSCPGHRRRKRVQIRYVA